MTLKNKNVLVITSCSAKKKSKSTKAIDLYEGEFFKKVKKFAMINNFDLKIISAKYGLLSPNDQTKPYNKKIEDNDDFLNLQNKIVPELEKIVDNYELVLIIMGNVYKKIISPIANDNFIYFFDKRGLGGYISLMTQLLKLKDKNLFDLLFQHRNQVITIDLIKKLNNNFKEL